MMCWMEPRPSSWSHSPASRLSGTPVANRTPQVASTSTSSCPTSLLRFLADSMVLKIRLREEGKQIPWRSTVLTNCPAAIAGKNVAGRLFHRGTSSAHEMVGIDDDVEPVRFQLIRSDVIECRWNRDQGHERPLGAEAAAEGENLPGRIGHAVDEN